MYNLKLKTFFFFLVNNLKFEALFISFKIHPKEIKIPILSLPVSEPKPKVVGAKCAQNFWINDIFIPQKVNT